MLPPDLALLQSAAFFDLRQKRERRHSAMLLRDLTVKLHAHIAVEAVFEIGAHEASFSRDVRPYVPNARIYAFEANPRNFEHFSRQEDLAKNRIRYLHRAITDRSGVAQFHVRPPTERNGMLRLTKNDSLLRRANSDESTIVEVAATSMSDFIEGEGLVGMASSAWVDVEGAAKQVFSGLGDRIGQFKLILCEVEDTKFWVDQWTSADVFSHLVGRNFVPVARDFEYPHQYNVLFLSPDTLQVPKARWEIAQYYAALGRHSRRWRWRAFIR